MNFFRKKPKPLTPEEAVQAIRLAGARIDAAFDACEARGLDPHEPVEIKKTIHHPFFSLAFEVRKSVPRWHFFHRP